MGYPKLADMAEPGRKTVLVMCALLSKPSKKSLVLYSG